MPYFYANTTQFFWKPYIEASTQQDNDTLTIHAYDLEKQSVSSHYERAKLFFLSKFTNHDASSSFNFDEGDLKLALIFLSQCPVDLDPQTATPDDLNYYNPSPVRSIKKHLKISDEALIGSFKCAFPSVRKISVTSSPAGDVNFKFSAESELLSSFQKAGILVQYSDGSHQEQFNRAMGSRDNSQRQSSDSSALAGSVENLTRKLGLKF